MAPPWCCTRAGPFLCRSCNVDSVSTTAPKDDATGQEEYRVANPHGPGRINLAGAALADAEHHNRVIDDDDWQKTCQEIGQDLSAGLGDGQWGSEKHKEETTAGKGNPAMHFGAKHRGFEAGMTGRCFGGLVRRPVGKISGCQAETGLDDALFFELP